MTPEEQRLKLAAMKPDGDRYVGSPEYLRDLLEQAGLSQSGTARRLRLNVRRFREYCSTTDRRPYPYVVQYAVESLVYGTEENPCE